MSDDFVEYILEGVKSGERHVIFCEPLAEFHLNLAFCPNRDECEELDDYIDQYICEPGELYDLVTRMCCGFCQSDSWIVVTTRQSALVIFLVSPEVGERLKQALDGLKEVTA